MSSPAPLVRRRSVLALALGGVAYSPAVWPHDDVGPVEPRRPAPALPLTLHDGRMLTLPRVLLGRVTALQLMFTGCSARCPVQGAIFGSLQQRAVKTVPGAQLLSVTLDPLSDDAGALRNWLQRYGAGPAWLAATPPVRNADVLLDFVAGRSAGIDRHSAQVYLFDRSGRLAYRFAELANAAEIATGMQALAQRG